MSLVSKSKNNISKYAYLKALKKTFSFFRIENNIGTYLITDGSINLSEDNGKWKVSCIERNRESYISYYENENEACKRILELYAKSKFKLWIFTWFYYHNIR